MQIPPDVLEAHNQYMPGKFSAMGLPPWAQQAQMAAKPTAQVLGDPGGEREDLATATAELEALYLDAHSHSNSSSVVVLRHI